MLFTPERHQEIMRQNKKNQELERHYKGLERLARLCGIERSSGKYMSIFLIRIKRKALEDIESFRRKGIDELSLEVRLAGHSEAIKDLFNRQLKGLLIDIGDEANLLKISKEYMSSIYIKSGLFKNYNGEGLLAREVK